MGGVSSAGAHDFGIFHNLYKNKNSDKITFDGGINLKLTHKQDIDMKNDASDFHQNFDVLTLGFDENHRNHFSYQYVACVKVSS